MFHTQRIVGGWVLLALVLLTLSGCAPSPPPEPLGTSMIVPQRVEPWGARGRQIHTDRYEIFTTLPSQNLTTLLPGFLEAAHENYLQLTGLPSAPPADPWTVYLFANRQEWDALTRARIGQSVPIEAGGYSYDGVCVFWNIGILPTLSVAAHESLHQFFHYRLVDRLPAWAEEGLCATAEGYDLVGTSVVFNPNRNLMRYADLRSTIGNHERWRDLESLLTLHSMEAAAGAKTSHQAVGYYGQLWALLHYIRNTPRYRAGLHRLVRDAATGRLADVLLLEHDEHERLLANPLEYNRRVSLPLFVHYIDPDLEAFEKAYRAHAIRLAGLE